MSSLRASRPVALLLLLTLWPALGLAQSAPPAGVVTGVQGRASLVRPVIAQPIPLKFKDDLFLRDQVETRENSLVRVLLGGKALVTIRELSTFAIIEEPGRAAIDLKSGKIAVGVAKSLLKPGEVIEIRTPNAIAAVRGSLLVATVTCLGGPPGDTACKLGVPQSSFTALDASLPITVTPLGGSAAPVALNANQAVGVSGIGASTAVGPVQNVTPDVARREAQTASAPRAADGQGTSSPMAAEISAAKAQEATALASLIAPPPTGATPPPADATLASATQTQLLQEPGSTVTAAVQTVVSTTPPPPSTGDLGVNAGAAGNISSGITSPPPPAVVDNPDLTIANTTVALQPGQTLKTYTGVSNRTGSSPVVQITNSQVAGPANLVEVAPGADAKIAGSVLQMTGPSVEASSLEAGSSVVDIRGRLETTTAASLVDIDPTQVTAANLFSIIGGNLVLAGPLLTDVGGTYALAGDLLTISGGGILSGSSPAALLQLSNSTVGAGRIFSVAGGSATLAGPLFSATNSVIGTTSDFADVLAGGVLTTQGTTEPLLSLSGGTVTVGGPRNQLLHVRGFQAGGSVPAVMDLSGPLLSVTGTPIVASGNLVRIADGGSISSSAGSPLVNFVGGSFTGGIPGNVSGGSLLRMFSEVGQSGTSLTLNGPYLVSSGANFATQDGSAFNIADGAVIEKGGSGPFVSFETALLDPRSVKSSASLFTFSSNQFFTVPGQPTTFGNGVAPSATLGGSLLSATNVSFDIGDPTANTNVLLFVGDGATVTSGAAPLLSFDGSQVGTAGGILSLRRSPSPASPSKLDLSGPLFAATGSTFDTSSLGFGGTFGTPGNCCSSFFIGQGAQITSSTGSPLIQLANSTFSSGPDLQSGANIVDVVDTFGGAPAAELRAPASVGLSGPLLSASNSTITALFHLVNVGRSSLSSETQAALIQLSGATVDLGGVNPITQVGTVARLLNLVSSVPAGTLASPASISLKGPVLLAINSDLTMTGDLIGVFNGATFDSKTSAPLVQLNGGSLTTTTASGFNGFVLDVGGLGGPTGLGFATAAFGGPLLNATGKLTLAGGLANIFGGGQVTTGATDPFVLITGGDHTIASSPGFAMFRLLGRNITSPVPDADSGLFLGTDRMIQGPDGAPAITTSLLETVGATIGATVDTPPVQKVLKIDHALLDATAPLLSLRPNGATQSILTTATDAIDVSFQARVSALGSSLIRLDNSVLNVMNGSLVNVNASKLSVTGDLVNLLNGATLTLFNGPLITVAGNGFVNITGGLINFGGTVGNTVNVTNNLCPCSLFGGVPVALQNGALASNVLISSPIKNPTLGTVNYLSPNAALAVVNGAGSKLIVGPQ